jgi:hypothetical protein
LVFVLVVERVLAVVLQVFFERAPLVVVLLVVSCS